MQEFLLSLPRSPGQDPVWVKGQRPSQHDTCSHPWAPVVQDTHRPEAACKASICIPSLRPQRRIYDVTSQVGSCLFSTLFK